MSLRGEEGPRLRRDPAGDPGREEDPAAAPAGRSERGERIRGGGSSKVFHGGRRERGNPTVCVPGSQRDPRAGGGGDPAALSVSSAGTRVGGGRSWDPGVGGERGSRGGGVSPGSRSSASGRVGRSAGVLRGRGGTQRRSPSLPLALVSSARRAGGAELSAAGPVPHSSAPPPLPPVPPWGAEEPLPPLPPPRPFCR